jgi:hypothetical protein
MSQNTFQLADKERIFDLLVEQLSRYQDDKQLTPKMVGMLNKRIGINGFKIAEVGTPVFDTGDRYLVMLESLDGKTNVEMSYYKDTLKQQIDFI